MAPEPTRSPPCSIPSPSPQSSLMTLHLSGSLRSLWTYQAMGPLRSVNLHASRKAAQQAKVVVGSEHGLPVEGCLQTLIESETFYTCSSIDDIESTILLDRSYQGFEHLHDDLYHMHSTVIWVEPQAKARCVTGPAAKCANCVAHLEHHPSVAEAACRSLLCWDD